MRDKHEGLDEDAQVADDLALFQGPPPAPGEPGYLTPQQMAEDWRALQRRISDWCTPQ